MKKSQLKANIQTKRSATPFDSLIGAVMLSSLPAASGIKIVDAVRGDHPINPIISECCYPLILDEDGVQIFDSAAEYEQLPYDVHLELGNEIMYRANLKNRPKKGEEREEKSAVRPIIGSHPSEGGPRTASNPLFEIETDGSEHLPKNVSSGAGS